jgi:AAA ATPase domain
MAVVPVRDHGSAPAAHESLLEREQQLATLGRCFGDVRDGHGRLVLVSGEAGIGKTTLVRRFCEADATDSPVLWGACDGLRTPRPLSPLLDVARTTGGSLQAAIDGGESRQVASTRCGASWRADGARSLSSRTSIGPTRRRWT